ncbi:hypothetical protein [Thalassomonas haliotis]|uniref:Class I lanthipeptide n=1 Tax=Thalassomonas haliotis TaxID=485448 RepID=A0ABY7VAM6_9GAMM|nr:hypothetical protein [Thalassomonas haliotis]WDE10591.1 hypothetical protein H3N35_20360 [Thalassomonas haliotis]
MKIQLNKKALVNLSQDDKKIPQELTPNIAGGGPDAPPTIECETMLCTKYQHGVNLCN